MQSLPFSRNLLISACHPLFCFSREVTSKNLPLVSCFVKSNFCWQSAEMRLPLMIGFNWWNANKISLNVKKKLRYWFWNRSKQTKFEDDLKIKLRGKRLYPTVSVKYLVLKIDTDVNWKYHVNDLSILNWIKPILYFSKWENMLVFKILRSIYFAISDSYLSYCCLVWAQNCSTIKIIVILQKKLLELLVFDHGIPIPV